MTKRRTTGGRTPTLSPRARTERPAAAPRGSTTLSLGTGSPRHRSATPVGTPAWTQRAREMSTALTGMLNRGKLEPAEAARLERAWDAWDLTGTPNATIARVAHLVDRAWAAMHEEPRIHSEAALQACAHVLYNGLPQAVRGRLDFPRVLALVRTLERDPELWPAVVRCTADLLGWSLASLAHAAHAIRIAQATKPQPFG